MQAAEDAVRVALEMREPVFEARAQLAVARVFASRGNEGIRVEAALARCEELITATGAERYSAEVREIRDRA